MPGLCCRSYLDYFIYLSKFAKHPGTWSIRRTVVNQVGAIVGQVAW